MLNDSVKVDLSFKIDNLKLIILKQYQHFALMKSSTVLYCILTP